MASLIGLLLIVYILAYVCGFAGKRHRRRRARNNGTSEYDLDNGVYDGASDYVGNPFMTTPLLRQGAQSRIEDEAMSVQLRVATRRHVAPPVLRL